MLDSFLHRRTDLCACTVSKHEYTRAASRGDPATRSRTSLRLRAPSSARPSRLSSLRPSFLESQAVLSALNAGLGVQSTTTRGGTSGARGGGGVAPSPRGYGSRDGSHTRAAALIRPPTSTGAIQARMTLTPRCSSASQSTPSVPPPPAQVSRAVCCICPTPPSSR